MSKVLRPLLQIAAFAVNFIPGIGQIAAFAITAGLVAGSALLGGRGGQRRAASAATLQLGEQPRQAVLGRAAVSGTLVDFFNYGGKYGTDWEVLVIALADHRCDALEGFFVDDAYHAFTGDGVVAGFNNQLEVYWRSGTWDQSVPAILTTNGPGWTANDRGRGVAHVVVAYKADKSDAKNPVWPGGRPRFRWVLRGLRCYQARKDSTVGGSGAHRRDNPATWEWTENPIDIRYNWVRGIYAGDRVTEPGMLLVGRGLSAIEAPPANVFPRANICDEPVDGQSRYRIGGVVASTEAFIEVENDFAAAVAGTISQPEGAVEVNPGQARSAIAHFTDADLLVGSSVTWNEGILGQQDNAWVNTVAARFVDPAQRWNVRSAPVRRELADVLADGGPREAQPSLDLVTNDAQAQRVAEVIRRLGRLWGRGKVSLPPRFAFIEEGDWVTWQSDRYFGGATFTFQVEAWGSDEAWHHQLTLRQISASVFSDTAPLDDGVIASTQPARPVVAAPAVGAWNASAVLLGSGSVRIPNLRVGGLTDDPAAGFVVFEYVQQAAAPTGTTIWTFAGSSRPDVTLFDIGVPEGGTFWVSVSYVVDGVQGERRVLGPLSTAGLSFSDGTPVAPVAPANANRVPFSRMEANRGWALIFNPWSLPASLTYGELDGRRFVRVTATASAAGQQITVGTNAPLGRAFVVTPGERLSVQSRLEAVSSVAGATYSLVLWLYDTVGVQTAYVIAAGSAPRGLLDAPLAGFVSVPAGMVAGRLEYFVVAGAAGQIVISACEPMVTSSATGQTVHPPYTPGPNAVDGALPNDLITIDGSGILNGIGTPSVPVNNALVPLGNANRVPFSRMEGDRGWFAETNSPGGISVGYASSLGRRIAFAAATASAAGEVIALYNGAPGAGYFPVTPGERLSVSARIGEAANVSNLFLNFGYLRADGTYNEVNIAGFAAQNWPLPPVTAFFTVPNDARLGRLILVAPAAAAGSYTAVISEPMVTSAAAGQTAHPPFTPGPNAFDAADVTAQQPVVGLLNPVTGRATSRRLASQIIASGVLQTLNTNPLSATTNGVTGVATITVNAHIVYDDFGSTSFSAASIGGLDQNTIYYVYESNPDFVGGARSYVATTDRNAVTSFGRRYVGFITTPAIGNPDTSGGGGGGAGWSGGNPVLLP